MSMYTIGMIVNIGEMKMTMMTCLNIAFENASADTVESGKIFSPQNWVKNKGCLKNIKDAVRTHLSTFKYTTEGKKMIDNMTKALKLDPTDFENRWSAD